MEIIVYYSPKKYRVIAIRDYLIKNNIPVTSIKLGFYMAMRSGRSGRNDELDISIEDFNEELNDAQVFEIYIDEKHEDNVQQLFENFDIETFFNDCIYKSNDYDEAFEVCRLLNKSGFKCDDVFTVTDIDTNTEEYLLFIDPEIKEDAMKIIEEYQAKR
ncbi:MAG: hypothetical protein FWD26_00295 [Treponema sp.]|nr:hypothetical protein [Treponema sp.]